jgi:Lipase (class 3)
MGSAMEGVMRTFSSYLSTFTAALLLTSFAAGCTAQASDRQGSSAEAVTQVAAETSSAASPSPKGAKDRARISYAEAKGMVSLPMGIQAWKVDMLENGHVQARAESAAGKTLATLDWDAVQAAEAPSIETSVELAGKETELMALAFDIFGGDAPRTAQLRDVQEIDLGASIAKANAGETRSASELRSNWKCYQSFAEASYLATKDAPKSVCGLTLHEPSANDVGKLYVQETKDATVALVSIAGTRGVFSDLVKDISSQAVWVKPVSQFGAKPAPGLVGLGWSDRWQEAAQSGIAQALQALEARAEQSDKPFELIVTGHSLGGAASSVAAMDGVSWLSGKSNKHHVRLVTFNSPALGNTEMRKSVQEALLMNDGSSATGTALSIHKFERGFDPVHNVPLGFGYVHPLWQEIRGARTLGTGEFATYSAADAPMFFADAVTMTPWKIGNNHRLGAWSFEIANTSDAVVSQMNAL